MLQIQHRFKSQTHNVFTEETNKITLSSNEIMQPIDIRYAYGASKNLVTEKDVIKCNNTIKR